MLNTAPSAMLLMPARMFAEDVVSDRHALFTASTFLLCRNISFKVLSDMPI